MIDRIILSVLERFGFTEDQANKVKKVLAMIAWEEKDGKKIVVIRPARGVELRLTQEEEKEETKVST